MVTPDRKIQDCVLRTRLTAGTNVINTNDLEKGIYFLRSENGGIVHKIIKE